MKKGAALLWVILIIGLFLALSAFLAKIVYNCYRTTSSAMTREQAFYLAEAGLEKGKIELAHNPNWFTDLPYYLEDNALWLAKYSVGDETGLGEGAYKVVREKGKNRLYAVGYKGKGLVIMKLVFSGTPPQFSGWQEL